MKHGLLIVAHRDFSQLKELLSYFDEDFEIYLHLDKKSGFSDGQVKELSNTRNVRLVTSAYSVNWGGHNLLKAILLLASEAVKNKNLRYIHLLSGQDFPIKALREFKRYFEDNNGKEFIEHFQIPSERWSEGGFERMWYFAPYDFINARGRYRPVLMLMLAVQKALRLKRPIAKKMPVPYGGSAWWSLTRECLEYVVKYTAVNPIFYQRLKNSFSPDEMYFQTIVMNSRFANKAVDDNLRYIDWIRNSSTGENPTILELQDLESIIASDHLIARKFVIPESFELLKALKVYLSKADAAVIEK